MSNTLAKIRNGQKREMKAVYTMTSRLTTVLSVLCTVTQVTHVSASMDKHGGVPMGHINVCDDAKTEINIDWDPRSSEEYTCDGGTITEMENKSQYSCEKKPKDPIHVCYPSEIHYDRVPPTSGKHRPNWADYGEYRYVPPQRWLHNLEHGAIVFLYHPCAEPEMVDFLRKMLTGCLRKHIITPSKLLPRDMPFALLSWGCRLMMGHINGQMALSFIKVHAKRDGPESYYAKSGKYNQSRIVPARIVSDFDDSVICPKSWMQGKRSDLWPVYGDDTSNLLPRPVVRGNPILLQSLRRRQLLKRNMGYMHRSFRSLEQHLQQLLSQ